MLLKFSYFEHSNSSTLHLFLHVHETGNDQNFVQYSLLQTLFINCQRRALVMGSQIKVVKIV